MDDKMDETVEVEEKQELGLFVVRSNSEDVRRRLLDDARDLLEIRRVHEIHWTPELVAENTARFYGGRPVAPFSAFLDGYRHDGPLLVITAVDRSPHHGERSTPKGHVRVNLNFFDALYRLRAAVTGGSHVHGSVSPQQTARDLMLLLGTDPEKYLEENPSAWDGRVEPLHRDLTGARGWSSPAELFYALNQSIRYVVLRNFEGLPDSLHVNAHDDVDVLADDYWELIAIMNARPHVRCIPPWGGPFWVKIANQNNWFDLRFVGDDYYAPKWAKEILARRVWNERGFHAPCAQDYFDSLAYHALVHKEVFSEDYKVRLVEMAKAIGRPGWDAAVVDDPVRLKALLDGIVERRGTEYRRPRDVNVFYNFQAMGHPWPYLRRKLAGIFRKGLRVSYRARHPLSVWLFGIREAMHLRTSG